MYCFIFSHLINNRIYSNLSVSFFLFLVIDVLHVGRQSERKAEVWEKLVIFFCLMIIKAYLHDSLKPYIILRAEV